MYKESSPDTRPWPSNESQMGKLKAWADSPASVPLVPAYATYSKREKWWEAERGRSGWELGPAPPLSPWTSPPHLAPTATHYSLALPAPLCP